MTPKRPRQKIVRKPIKKLPPIVVVPNKSYLDDTGNVIPTDVILVSDPMMYLRMQKVLEAWGEEPLGLPGRRDGVEG